MMMANVTSPGLSASRKAHMRVNAATAGYSSVIVSTRRSQLCNASSSPQDANFASDGEHPEARDFDDDTRSFNFKHLGTLGERIAQIRQAQALHMLQHRYTPSTLLAAVEESLETRPDMSVGYAELEEWHHKQWKALKTVVEDAP